MATGKGTSNLSRRGTIMEHISNLSAGAFTSMAKRLGMTYIGRLSAHRFIGDIRYSGTSIHIYNHRRIRCSNGVGLKNIPSFSVTVRIFIDGKVADRREISVWEYADISKAIDEVKAFIG